MAVLQVTLVQRAFRRNLPHWLDALGRYRGLADGGPALRRLGEGLARNSAAYGIGDLEAAAGALARDPRPALLDDLLDHVRREMHPTDLAARARMPVLVAAADRTLSGALADAARRFAGRVEVVGSVDDARRRADDAWPGLVLLEAELPGDGLGWLVELRSVPEGPDLPVAVFSLHGATRPDALALGASEFVALPVPPPVIEEVVGSWLGHEGRTMLELAGDPVTGLPGPGMFQEAVTDLSLHHRGRKWAAILVAWRNRATATSENATRADAAARALAQALLQRYPAPALVARLDQETFGIALPAVDRDEIEAQLLRALADLERAAPIPVDLGIGGVICLDAEYRQVLGTARRMHELAVIAGQRLLLTTLDEAPAQRILLVHDDADVAEVLRGALRGTRSDLVLRRSPVDGLDAAASSAFDLVVLGASLPDQGAFDALRTLRSWPSYERAPILVLTTDDRERVLAYELGADECLSLPLGADILRARLRGRAARSA